MRRLERVLLAMCPRHSSNHNHGSEQITDSIEYTSCCYKNGNSNSTSIKYTSCCYKIGYSDSNHD